MDVGMVEILKKKICVSPCDQPSVNESMRDGQIQKEPWGVVYKAIVNKVMKNRMMYLQDTHCYKTSTLNGILMKVELCKMNAENEIKCLYDILRWQISLQTIVMTYIPQVLEGI